jgi:hypothetical protein
MNGNSRTNNTDIRTNRQSPAMRSVLKPVRVLCRLFCVGVLAVQVSTAAAQGPVVRDLPPGTVLGVDLMDVRNFTLMDYQRMFVHGRAPAPNDLLGTWRGVNKGVVTLVGFRQFVKEIQPCGDVILGENIDVHQVSSACLRSLGWQSKIDESGNESRRGKFMVKTNSGPDRQNNPAEFSYREGGNRRTDPVRLLVDKVVKLDDNHLLGRASAQLGLVRVPIAFFVLERVD